MNSVQEELAMGVSAAGPHSNHEINGLWVKTKGTEPAGDGLKSQSESSRTERQLLSLESGSEVTL